MSPPKSFTVDPSALHRFLEKVAPPNENHCELWTASLDHNGYGQFFLRVDGTRRTVKAHLVPLSLSLNGRFPPDMEPDHTCTVRHCVSVSHIEWVTPEENRRRVFSRMKVCRAGLHSWVPENWRMLKKGPTCVLCERAARNQLYHRTKVLTGRVGVAKLTENDVVQIRASAWCTTQADLSRQFGVAPGTIRAVIEQRTWKNVQSVT